MTIAAKTLSLLLIGGRLSSPTLSMKCPIAGASSPWLSTF